ncbi:MAG: hypothetical protein JW909_04120 [Planctomycetes bacterium]|nr:hypothetical protein [Planctomycetota bacterium]
MRTAYAVLLFAVVVIFYMSEVYSSNILYAYGTGLDFACVLLALQAGGILFFLPAMAGGCIAGEKETGSLSLLLVSGLGPWEILFQKYAARLVPMLSFILLSLPPLMLAYSVGGVSAEHIFIGVFILLVVTFQVGALALMMSSIWGTVAVAIVASYVALAAMFGVYQPFLEHDAAYELPSVLWYFGVPGLLTTAFFLLIARVFLFRRAFASSENPVLAFFRWLDRGFTRVNRRIGGLVVVKEAPSLPGDDPVFWREHYRRSLGSFRYLLRILLVLLLAALVCISYALAEPAGYRGEASPWIAVPTIAGYGLAVLIIAVVGVNFAGGERTRRTLDVLLTTPMSAAEVIRQKARACRRLLLVLAAPIAVLIAANAATTTGHWSYFDHERSHFLYLALALGSLATIFPATLWFAAYMGARIRSRARALIFCLACIAGWSVATIGLIVLIVETGRFHDESVLQFLVSLFPGLVVLFTALNPHISDIERPLVAGMFCGLAINLGLLFLFRLLLLRNADRYLSRG